MLEVVRSPTADTRDGEVLPAHARWLDGAGKFLGQVPGRPQRLVAAHAQGKVTQDDIVLATLELRLDRRRTAIAEIRDSSHRLEAGMLDGGSRGQDVVGHEGRGRHDELEHDDEVHGAEGIHDELRIGIGNQRIGPIDDERAHAIGLAGDGSLPYALRQSRGEVSHGQVTPPLAGTFVGELPAGIALEAAIGFVETVGTGLGGQLRAVLELELAHEARCLVENVAAGHVDVARDSTQCSDDAMQRGGVGADLVDATPRE